MSCCCTCGYNWIDTSADRLESFKCSALNIHIVSCYRKNCNHPERAYISRFSYAKRRHRTFIVLLFCRFAFRRSHVYHIDMSQSHKFLSQMQLLLFHQPNNIIISSDWMTRTATSRPLVAAPVKLYTLSALLL
uniref:Uncharacterized protein n=1 Tax=Parascaris univalens TaxID=6257 RepID=A0A915C323_PARUN